MEDSIRAVPPSYTLTQTELVSLLPKSPKSDLTRIDAKNPLNGISSQVPPLPTPPPIPDHKANITPPNRTTSPHPNRNKKKKAAAKQVNGEPQLPPQPASAGLIDGRVPPINVLIVEDNVINLRLLEQFMRRLKVRWKSAMNGKEAVSMWREGGFHLVLMDIQLPVMNGLEATKEIRRLESTNGIGLSIFGNNSPSSEKKDRGQLKAEDRLKDRNLFKSPVIIVALTASSLQSDRHEALAVGCNDFLTKPVNFGWMERKVTEWGCMQALIDFNGWRKWKEIAEKKESGDPEKRKQEEKEAKAKSKAELKALFSRPPPSSKKETSNEKKEDIGGPNSASSSTSNLATEQPTPPPAPSRRGHKGSRGSLGSVLQPTLEVDEKGS